MRVVLAPDSFKGSVTARDAAEALAEGWRAVRPRDELVELPLADGGEGTVAVLASASPTAVWHPQPVSGPDGRTVEAGWLLRPDGTAVVELAMAAGPQHLRAPDPLGASTFGVGELLRSAAEHPGTGRILVALGGSASTDGGVGALAALGAELLDRRGRLLPADGGSLQHLSVVLPPTVAPPPGGVTCLVDVTAPLLGPLGAAAQFGPQKGATGDDVAHLERGLTRLAGVLGTNPERAGSGAAGGTAYGLSALWSATIVPGAPVIATAAGLPDAIGRADLVVTGEGRFDLQSRQGKCVGHVLETARTAAVPVHLAVGELAARPPAGVVATAELTGLAGSALAARTDARRWLVAAGRTLAAAASGAGS
ncbi:glycerate kinase [Dactylosporangium sp. AC04546]|uniref:glycerate kinase n=1 Tax=Dactylosporangium sp. AC04546 TaxID=2862460 RepID=UPI001EDFF9B3|nr:glycerate kinase [Dactylosporangium sp. AC04546]WVK89041.1 glycerate kinase [Dactylosporangium sp. AC04546]